MLLMLPNTTHSFLYCQTISPFTNLLKFTILQSSLISGPPYSKLYPITRLHNIFVMTKFYHKKKIHLSIQARVSAKMACTQKQQRLPDPNRVAVLFHCRDARLEHPLKLINCDGEIDVTRKFNIVSTIIAT